MCCTDYKLPSIELHNKNFDPDAETLFWEYMTLLCTETLAHKLATIYKSAPNSCANLTVVWLFDFTNWRIYWINQIFCVWNILCYKLSHEIFHRENFVCRVGILGQAYCYRPWWLLRPCFAWSNYLGTEWAHSLHRISVNLQVGIICDLWHVQSGWSWSRIGIQGYHSYQEIW